jgi:HEAT repeats
LITGFTAHPDSQIRFAVACALGSFPNDERSVKALLLLSEDTDEEVRDWATFGLGVLGDMDSREIRDALARRLDDSNADACEEAMVGLGKRRDEHVLPGLMNALRQPAVSCRVVEAAYLMLGMESDREDWSAADYASALQKQFEPHSPLPAPSPHPPISKAPPALTASACDNLTRASGTTSREAPIQGFVLAQYSSDDVKGLIGGR